MGGLVLGGFDLRGIMLRQLPSGSHINTMARYVFGGVSMVVVLCWKDLVFAM